MSLMKVIQSKQHEFCTNYAPGETAVRISGISLCKYLTSVVMWMLDNWLTTVSYIHFTEISANV